MAEKETENEPKDMIEPIIEKIVEEKAEKKIEKEMLSSWTPKTELGKAVKDGKEKDIDKILEKSKKILESEIVDYLLDLESELLLIGQAKGKFGGGKRRAWRQTQKKTMEGNVITFSTMLLLEIKMGMLD